MGPQHPSTHGVLRLILELEGETVTEARCGIGYLHTGIEKNMEYRDLDPGRHVRARAWTTCRRSSTRPRTASAVEKLLGITDEIPERATVIRVMLMELNRISSHLVCLATGGMELGALTVMTIGFRERELVLDVFELITGLRMNHAYIRPGGLAQDLPPGAVDKRPRVRRSGMRKHIAGVRGPAATRTPSSRAALQGVGYLDLTGCMALGITGPVLRSTGLP